MKEVAEIQAIIAVQKKAGNGAFLQGCQNV